jgi:hypothetical protein
MLAMSCGVKYPAMLVDLVPLCLLPSVLFFGVGFNPSSGDGVGAS